MRNTVHTNLATLLAVGLAASASGAVLIVDTLADADAMDGQCSLREAIQAANLDTAYNDCPAGDGDDQIDLPLLGTLLLSSDLPVVTETVLIAGAGSTVVEIDGAELYSLLVIDSPAGGEWLGVQDLRLTRGRSVNGGGARIGDGDLGWFGRVHFLANTATNAGGAVFADADLAMTTVTLEECTVEDNVAEGVGGGGGVVGFSSLTTIEISRSTLTGNQAAGPNAIGGAVLSKGTAIVQASTISGNTAHGSGGGIDLATTIATPVSLTMRDSTVFGNQADLDGDGIGDGGGIRLQGSVGDAELDVLNSVIAMNSDGGGLLEPDLTCGGSVLLIASGWNVLGSNEGCSTLFPAGLPNANGDYVGTAAAELDPALDALMDNGGPTSTHLPLYNSPVVDRGSCPGVPADQRGYGDAGIGTRAVDIPAVSNPIGGDGCDIGAVERLADPDIEGKIFSDGFESTSTLRWSNEV